jgi:hypothetical protein
MTGLLLEGRRAVITGAANGIGRETAKVCAREGARVGVLDVNEEGAQRTASEVEMAGGEALTLVADLCDEGQVKAAVSRCAESWGGLDNRADRLELIDDDPATPRGPAGGGGGSDRLSRLGPSPVHDRRRLGRRRRHDRDLTRGGR